MLTKLANLTKQAVGITRDLIIIAKKKQLKMAGKLKQDKKYFTRKKND